MLEFCSGLSEYPPRMRKLSSSALTLISWPAALERRAMPSSGFCRVSLLHALKVTVVPKPLNKQGRPMAINLAHRPDLDSRVEKLAGRLGLTGRGRKTATIERALVLLEERVADDRPDRTAIETSLDRYIINGTYLRERLAPRGDDGSPLSLSLQQALYGERRLP